MPITGTARARHTPSRHLAADISERGYASSVLAPQQVNTLQTPATTAPAGQVARGRQAREREHELHHLELLRDAELCRLGVAKGLPPPTRRSPARIDGTAPRGSAPARRTNAPYRSAVATARAGMFPNPHSALRGTEMPMSRLEIRGGGHRICDSLGATALRKSGAVVPRVRWHWPWRGAPVGSVACGNPIGDQTSPLWGDGRGLVMFTFVRRRHDQLCVICCAVLWQGVGLFVLNGSDVRRVPSRRGLALTAPPTMSTPRKRATGVFTVREAARGALRRGLRPDHDKGLVTAPTKTTENDMTTAPRRARGD